jgi:FAD/FMN-containing dehydrogenase
MRLLRREDPGFAEACYGRIFNARRPLERTPAAVACPRSDEEVVRAVDRHRAWVHGHMGRIAEQVGEGLYIGDSDFTRRADRFLAEANAARLAQLRGRHDPDGVFSG